MNRRDFLKATSIVGVPLGATTALIASPTHVEATQPSPFNYVDYESLLHPGLLKNIETEDINKIKHIFDEILHVCNEVFWIQLPCRDFNDDTNGGLTRGDVHSYPLKSFVCPGILNYNLNVLSCSIRCHLMLMNHQSVVPCGLRDLKKQRPYLMHSGEIAGDNGLFCDINSETIVLNSWFTTQ